MTPRFIGLTLRTTQVDAARAFYTQLLGAVPGPVVPLSPDIIARGARPHWLGFVRVTSLEATVQVFLARGATRLGPTYPTAAGGEYALLRDPGGAVVAFTTDSGRLPFGVVWVQLDAAQLPTTRAAYLDILGWHALPLVDMGEHGVFEPFAWQAGGPAVGSMGDIAARPGVHPHWQFHFRVPSLEAATAQVRAAGGVVIASVTLKDGARIAVCDDPQGAALTLREG